MTPDAFETYVAWARVIPFYQGRQLLLEPIMKEKMTRKLKMRDQRQYQMRSQYQRKHQRRDMMMI